jgi:uncharacterized protein
MEKIRLDIIGMKYSQSQGGAYALILEERDGKRRLPIIIGAFEAQAIAIELEKIRTPRPLTHDLFRAFAEAYEIQLTEVVISKFQEGVFFATLVCMQGENEQEIDSRTSDAIALALRFNCPIFTYDEILDVAGIMIEEEAETEPEKPARRGKADTKNEFSEFSEQELKEMLQAAIENEEYEKASRIRDEIKHKRGE